MTEEHLPCIDYSTQLLLQQEAVEQLGKRVALLEGELRAAKRRETKLAATHFRLRQDLASADGDLKCAVFERNSAIELREYTPTVTSQAPTATSSARLAVVLDRNMPAK